MIKIQKGVGRGVQEILDRHAICHYISPFYRIRRLSVVRPVVSLRQNPGYNPEK